MRPRPGPSVPDVTPGQQVQAAAEALLADAAAIGASLAEHSIAETPEFDDHDAELHELARASCVANVTIALEAVRHGVRAPELHPPPAALAFARLVASRRIGSEAITRSYVLTQQRYVSDWLVPAIVRHVERPEHHAQALADAISTSHAQLDRILTTVSAEYVAARERLVGSARIAQADLVEAVLSRDTVDSEAMSRRLRYPLSETHVAWVLWSPPDGPRMCGADVVTAAETVIGGALGGGPSLLLPRGDSAVWGWTRATDAAGLDADLVRDRLSPEGRHVHVALGEALPGAAGFRRSHRQALRAQQAVQLAARAAPSATRYRQVALLSLLMENPVAARDFVLHELGALADDRAASVRPRQTLRSYYENNASPVQTARELHLHRNTVLYRLQRAEALLGAPVAERSLERHAALVLLDWLRA